MQRHHRSTRWRAQRVLSLTLPAESTLPRSRYNGTDLGNVASDTHRQRKSPLMPAKTVPRWEGDSIRPPESGAFKPFPLRYLSAARPMFRGDGKTPTGTESAGMGCQLPATLPVEFRFLC